MNKNLQSPTKLTEFGALEAEEKPQGVGQFISKFFKLTRSVLPEDNTPSTSENVSPSQESMQSWVVKGPLDSSYGKREPSNVYPLDVNEGRSLPNVLKRISNLLALKSNNLQDYADTELKQYWMPDSVSKECYECGEKFTTFRRRHHCRVCGQIFCSQCCKEQIPGKIFGCTGDLRVCTYCCKIVLSYLQSSDDGCDLTADLRLLQENLQNKFGSPVSPSASQQDNSVSSLNTDSLDVSNIIRRKISVGYQEENFASGGSTTYLSTEEKCRALQNSVSLRSLFEEICKATTGIHLGVHKYRLRTYTDCFLGSELVDWLICQQKANSRVQAVAICQALLEGGYIESVSEPSSFVDGYALYKPGVLLAPMTCRRSMSFDVPTQDEPMWVQQIPQESSTTDSENEQVSPIGKGRGNLPCSSSYTLDLNLEANTVYLSKPSAVASNLQSPTSSDPDIYEYEQPSLIRTSEQRELVPESVLPLPVSAEEPVENLFLREVKGWHNASTLREDNGEKLAYNLLTESYGHHEQSLLKQLLCANGLSLSWVNVILPLVYEIVEVIRPDKNHNAEDLDIRHYVQFKKLCGGNRSDTRLVRGIVCSKNVAHKWMATEIEDPKILLLQCSIVYQRTEGRLMSLEPVLMQEHEYLKHVANRIDALKPDVVLVQKNVSRLAQDLLRLQGITLVHNVKQSVLERIARCTGADLVTAVDSHIGRPKLATCKKFHLKKFGIEKGNVKTLMYFEGLPMPHLGATVLLRGGSKPELSRLEQVASFIVFAAYNWRLEKSFLMDEFAQPPNSTCEFLDDSKENSPTLPETKIIIDDKNKTTRISKTNFSQESFDDSVFMSGGGENKNIVAPEKNEKEETKRTNSELVSDFTDPLHSYKADEYQSGGQIQEKLSVAELPFSNRFRKALDDAILCISPYIVFSMPYLETEVGKRCKIRQFFPADIYYSKQFDVSSKIKPIKDVDDIDKNEKNKMDTKDKSLHPFLTTKFTADTESNKVQGLLANFRACGGSYKKKELLHIVPKENEEEIRKKLENECNLVDKQDVLDSHNHQRLVVLFCSYSHESVNAPSFCVNPWVVYMDFYVRNDIPLGFFLEKYCFRLSYECPSKNCDTPMLKHVRRFVHNAGCVSIALNNFENEFPEDGIVMWSWCAKCQTVSPVVPMSVDTWSFSFAKFLELKFHGGIYTRRGISNCNHSLHHDHCQYFGYKKYVASFTYSPVQLWEISLPPSVIEVQYDVNKIQNELIDDIRLMAQKGHEVYSIFAEKLTCLPAELEGLGNLKQLLTKEQAHFKQKIEEVQLKLTSPSIENKDFIEGGSHVVYWGISDAVIKIKRMIVDTVDQWNVRLGEAAKKRDSDKKKEKLPSADLESPSSVEQAEEGGGDVRDNESDPVSSHKRTMYMHEDTSINYTTHETDDITTSTLNDHSQRHRFIQSHHRSMEIGKHLPHDECSKDGKHLTVDGDSTNPSPKCHQRSQSDGTVMSHNEEAVDTKKETDRKSMKNILQQLLPSNAVNINISVPFNSQEHYTLPVGVMFPVVVYENEASSIIAYALNSYDYKKSLEASKKPPSAEQSPSPIHKRKSYDKFNMDGNEQMKQPPAKAKDIREDLLSGSINAALAELSQTEQMPNSEKPEDTKKLLKNLHVEVQFEDANCNFFCRIYFAEKFAALRSVVLPIGEEGYVRSLTRSAAWNAKGGKSGSNFAKTLDDRFVLKEMSKSELQLFLESAHNYFLYMHRCYTTGQPTLLGKIVGIYRIVFKNNNTSGQCRTNLLVMENLFYNRTVTQKFDLKGSMRNRLVVPDGQDGEIVLLDENLLKMSRDCPLYILPHSKAVLSAAIQNDTEFLAAQSVIDYSLLVGLDTENKELVLGIIGYSALVVTSKTARYFANQPWLLASSVVRLKLATEDANSHDYIRRFTWDKKIETMVKKSGILGGQGKLPTIISPEEYQKRFIEAMHRYFLEVPDHWGGLGKGLEF